ncbi:MAG: hypothetical protein V4495_24590 [Pseudomonadota bacterium]
MRTVQELRGHDDPMRRIAMRPTDLRLITSQLFTITRKPVMPDLIRHPASLNFGFKFRPFFATGICSAIFLNTGASAQRKPLDDRSGLA